MYRSQETQLQCSPEQIAESLNRTFSGSEDYQVSHETIYRSLFIQAHDRLSPKLVAGGSAARCARLLPSE